MTLRHLMRIAALAAAASTATVALASSHREAPFITGMPKVDATDFYMFRSYEPGRAGYVTLIANYLPLQDAYGGPNYFALDPDALYEIHVDNNGDAVEDLTFQFRFTNTYNNIKVDGDTGTGVVNNSIPLINLPPTDSTTPVLNLEQTYSVRLVRGTRRGGSVTNLTNAADGSTTFKKPVDNIGAKSIPDYDGPSGYDKQFVHAANIPGCGAGKVFVGQRREGFVVNLGQVFDLVNLNPLGARDSASNTIANKNVTSIALEVPVACLTAGDPVIGAWTTASKRQGRLLNPAPVGPVATMAGRGPSREGGAWTQVSRLGSPLVNEVVIGIADKDKFNASQPKDDVANFGAYVLYPTLPVLVNALFSVPPPASPRYDLAYAFVTGIRANVNGTMTDFTHPANVNLSTLAGAGEMLRLNTAFPTPANATAPSPASDLGFLACDLNGFPNGRRPVDDVVDIELTVAEGAIDGTNAANLQTCDVSGSSPTVVNPGAVVNDGALPNAADYLAQFPYLNSPLAGSP